MSIIARSIASIGVTQNPFAMASAGYLANNQNGRSGVNRMMLIQLQEESLRQDELRKKQAEQKQEKPKEVPKPTKKPKKKKKVQVAEEPEVEQEPVVFRPIPAFTRLPDEPDFGAIAVKIALQVQVLLAGYTATALKFTEDKTQDEEDLELLLLSI